MILRIVDGHLGWKQITRTHRVILQSRDVRLHGPLHVAGGDQGRGQIDVPVDEVWLEPDGVTVVV